MEDKLNSGYWPWDKPWLRNVLNRKLPAERNQQEGHGTAWLSYDESRRDTVSLLCSSGL